MKRTMISSWSVALIVFCTVPACDAQEGPDYQGDSLLRINGSVAIPQGLEGEPLVPVLGFPVIDPVTTTFDHETILDVGVDGDFPSSFTADVFDPPPAEALWTPEIDGGQPVAVGYLAAMSPSHPSAVRVTPAEGTSAEQQVASCTLDGTSCSTQSFQCNPEAFSLNDCTLIASTGAPNLAFFGYSQNIAVVYVAERVEAGTMFSTLAGDGRAIEPGYHLIKLHGRHVLTETENLCYVESVNAAVAAYNAEHGTAYTAPEIPDLGNQAIAELRTRQFAEVRERGCPAVLPHEVVEDADSTPISIQLGVASPRAW